MGHFTVTTTDEQPLQLALAPWQTAALLAFLAGRTTAIRLLVTTEGLTVRCERCGVVACLDEPDLGAIHGGCC